MSDQKENPPREQAEFCASNGSAIPIAIVFYDPKAPEDSEMSVKLTATAVGFLATLTDFELKVIAAEAGLRVRKAFEMPPSPNDGTQRPGTPDGSLATETRKPGSLK